MLYNTGTIAINGNTATGTGTNWTAPASQIRVGQTLFVLSNPVQMFQITAINSATSLTITPAASPALSGQKYGILVTDSLSVDGLAQSMSQLINEYDENIGAWETFATTAANQNVTVTINGTRVTIPAIGKLAQKGSNGAIPIGQGGTGATNVADARTNLGLGTSAILNARSNETYPADGVLTVGQFGIGADWLPLTTDFKTIEKGGIYAGGGATGVNFFNPYAPVLVMCRYATSAMQALQADNTTLAFNVKDANGWRGWVKLYSEYNTTRASDGTLKAASPVVAIFSDGSYRTNDESEGCTVTRLVTGQYLVEGCQGLNSDAAWGGIDGGFDIPTDRNKQPLIWLDYEVNADGSVLVKTYHRTHPDAPAFARNELEGVGDGDPVDIPSDQFVSVRVEMPADSLYNQKIRAAELAMTADAGE
ncbi:phage tail protein [Enterobacter hormaechei]|uniref:phage tail fiber protein n=1 Tax=Enterobacter hormaechei TaxID=158836 RepID=UPI0013D038E8|nr:phage tail protein [Enterobacter hormaechei]MCC4520159.1 phage tail protein [Enterobacter hormaechei]MCC4542681.1 phage tail protein [Enterobacter hormaechei]